MITNVTYFDIPYQDQCQPVNQLPTMSGGLTGSFVSGSITYKYHTWGTNESFETGSAGSDCTGSAGIFRVDNLGNICTAQLLVVAGGGGGGKNGGPGGGAGQVIYVPNFPLRKTRYCCKRGEGGNGATVNGQGSQNGGDSTFYLDLFPYRPSPTNTSDYIFSLIAKGGGGLSGSGTQLTGSNGGSGGGAIGGTATTPNDNQITASCATGSAIYNTSVYYYGSNGGCGIAVKSGSISDASGGGGGAINSGSNATAIKGTSIPFTTATGGNGGDGIGLTMISSSVVYYAGGGGGGGQTTTNGHAFGGNGGLGGGGNGGSATGLVQGTTGSAFTGGGGGGGRGFTGLTGPDGLKGGSGTIIITYKYQLD